MSTQKRKVEVFSAGCPACDETVSTVRRLACPSCEVTVLDMKDPAVAARARTLGLHTVPAVLVGGTPAGCCGGCAPDEAALRAAGLGLPLA